MAKLITYNLLDPSLRTILQSSNSGSASASGSRGVIAPFFVDPTNILTNNNYNEMIEITKEFPSVPIIMVINPSSGPGETVNSDYATAIKRLTGAGITVVGYISLQNGSKSFDVVKSEIDKWTDLYPEVKGAFFNSVPNADPISDLNKNIIKYASENGMPLTIGYVDAIPVKSYFDEFDVVVIQDSPWSEVESNLATLKGDSVGGLSEIPIAKKSLLITGDSTDILNRVDIAKNLASWVYYNDTSTNWSTKPSTQTLKDLLSILGSTDAQTIDKIRLEQLARKDQDNIMKGSMKVERDVDFPLGVSRGASSAGSSVGMYFKGRESRNGYLWSEDKTDGTHNWHMGADADGITKDARKTNFYLHGTGAMFIGGNKVWTEGNDGHGSGLNADKVDDIEGANIQLKKTWTVPNVNKDTYKNIATVSTSSYSSKVKFSFGGTGNSIVVATIAEILANHHQSIMIESLSGSYTQLSLKVDFDDHGNYDLSVKLVTAATTIFDLIVTAEYTDCTVASHTNNPAPVGKTLSHTHNTESNKKLFTNSANSVKMKINDQEVWTMGPTVHLAKPSDADTGFAFPGNKIESHVNGEKIFETNAYGINMLKPGSRISFTGTSDYDKLRVWDSQHYAIGMAEAMTYGYLNAFAMTFTMGGDTDNGYIWRHTDNSKAQGAMSLTTDGRLYVNKLVDSDKVKARTSMQVGGWEIKENPDGSLGFFK